MCQNIINDLFFKIFDIILMDTRPQNWNCTHYFADRKIIALVPCLSPVDTELRLVLINKFDEIFTHSSSVVDYVVVRFVAKRDSDVIMTNSRQELINDTIEKFRSRGR